MSRAPRLGTSGDFFRRFLVGQKAAASGGCRQQGGWINPSSPLITNPYPTNNICQQGRRRARTPALHCGWEWAAIRKRQPTVRLGGGPMQVSASTQGGAPRPSSAYHACRSRLCRPYALRCRAGVHARREVCIGLTLWFCVSAAPQGRGGLRQPGRVLARSCAAPLSRLTPTAPLTGEPFRRQFPQSLPCKGRWMRRKAQTGGVAGWRWRYPARSGRGLPCVS